MAVNESTVEAAGSGWAAACVPASRKVDGRELPRGSTARTHRLAQRAATRRHTYWLEADAARRRLMATAPEGMDDYAREARFVEGFLGALTPCIRADELIVGAFLRCHPDEMQQDAPLLGWLPDGAGWIDAYAGNAPPDRPDLLALCARGLLSPVGPCCHRVVDWAAVLHEGCAALAQKAHDRMATADPSSHPFLDAVARYHQAHIDHARRYAEKARMLAEPAYTRSEARRAELLEIADICERVPALPARTFREALQSFWLVYYPVTRFDLGRLDQWLYPFYRDDLAAGRLTEAEALELLECFLVKLHDDYVCAPTNVSSIHTLTLGGVTADGQDACNELTRLTLQALRTIRLSRPTVYLRCHDGTPDELVKLAVTMQSEGLAEPNIYGDRPIVDGLVRVGVPLEEARNYALGGCTEVVSPGKGNWGAPTGWINVAMLIDEALRQAAAEGVKSMERFWPIFETRLEEVADACRDITEWFDRTAPGDVFISAVMPCCIEAARCFNRGGADSYYGQWAGVGLPNAANMLHAARTQCFEGGGALAALFELVDHEDEATLARLRSQEAFGNGIEAVDRLADEILQRVSSALECRSTALRRAITLGHLSGGQSINIDYGMHMGATLDGRRGGQALADSLAGSHGACRRGPTALVRSVTALDHSRLQAGNVTTLMLNQSDFAGADGIDKLTALVRTFVTLGGSQLQFNLVDAKVLKQAREHPEEHRGLMVRVAGYSADFTRVGGNIQDEMIARLEGLS